MSRRVPDQAALERSVASSTKASARLSGRVVPPDFVRPPRVEAWLAARRRPEQPPIDGDAQPAVPEDPAE